MSRIVSSSVAVTILENPGKMRIISSFLKVRLLVKLNMNIILINFTDNAVMFFLSCRWRRKGYSFFKSKAVLMTVVCLCIVDCALVLGELTLDLYKVKGKKRKI